MRSKMSLCKPGWTAGMAAWAAISPISTTTAGSIFIWAPASPPGYVVPNRMFKNVAGSRFEDITGSSRTGHLQKGHGMACGDWDRDGDVDLFIEMGGAVTGENITISSSKTPARATTGSPSSFGRKTNRAAIGARIKVVTDEPQPRTIHRIVSSGSSFGANPLEQTIGLAGAKLSRGSRSTGRQAIQPRFFVELPPTRRSRSPSSIPATGASITNGFGSPTESERSRTRAGSSCGTGADRGAPGN